MTPNHQRHYEFTVFTATYNRAYLLHRVYESLRAQTFRDFEWLIIDDGSTDNTAQMVKTWQKLGSFPIRYVYQDNGGLHAAYNIAATMAQGNLFLQLDSDDACVPHALERFKYYWDSIPKERRTKFAGIVSLCVDQYGNLVGGKFPHDVTESDMLEMVFKHKVHGEKWAVYTTDVSRQFLYPMIEGYRFFIPQGLVHYAVAHNFKTLFVNEPLRIYGYYDRPDQITAKAHPSKHAVGQALFYRDVLNRHIRWFPYSPQEFLRSAGLYARFSFHAKSGVLAQFKQLTNALAKILWLTTLPVGFLYYLKDGKSVRTEISARPDRKAAEDA